MSKRKIDLGNAAYGRLLSDAIARTGLTNVEFAAAADCELSTLQSILSGRMPISQELGRRIRKALNSPIQSQHQVQSVPVPPASDLEQRLNVAWRGLEEAHRETLVGIAEGMKALVGGVFQIMSALERWPPSENRL